MEEKKGLSIASMVLGIVSLVLCCIVYISVPCALLAMKKGGKGMAIAGLVLGIITMGLWVLGWIAGASLIAGMTEALM